jgi:hypothetical protein
LQATWIQNVLLNAIGNRSQNPSSANFVYTYPNITLLAHFVMDTAHGSSEAGQSNGVETTITKMTAMVEEFTSFPLPAKTTTNVRPNGAPTDQVFLITGTTGGLGSHLLRDACECEKVVRVYAFNRPQKKASLVQRQRDVLREYGLDESIIDTEKIVLLEGDLMAENFGLEQSVYQEASNIPELKLKLLSKRLSLLQLADSVTHIIHNGMFSSLSILFAGGSYYLSLARRFQRHASFVQVQHSKSSQAH